MKLIKLQQLVSRAREILKGNKNDTEEDISTRWGAPSYFTYKLGLFIPTSVRFILPVELSTLYNLLHKVDMIVCSASPRDHNDKTVISSLYQCNDTIQRLLYSQGDFQGKPVVFSSRWPDTTSTGITNYSSLHNFWFEMNKLAIEKHISVIMHEAFELPREQTLARQTTRWWRLVENSSYRNSYD